MLRLRTTALCAALLTLSCATEPRDRGSLALRLSGLAEAGLPDDVHTLRIRYAVEDGPEQLLEARVSELEDAAGHRRLALPELPAGTPIRVRVEGLDPDEELLYVGVLGPLTLGRGENLRRAVALAPAQVSLALEDGAPPGRFLHTAVRLPDGRVLIAGGFAEPTPATCPAEIDAEAQCYALSARADAWLFDPNEMRFHEVAGGMLEARAGHSASVLPDGRVLLAGGAPAALLVLHPSAPDLAPLFLPRDAAGGPVRYHAHYELFEPALEGDPRDPARGRFVGSLAEPERAGPLLSSRFLHAAGVNPVEPSQVLLAGGLGGAASTTTYEVFDSRREGGYGPLPGSLGALPTPRGAAGALSLRVGELGWVWLFGGSYPRNNDELADRWTPSPAGPAGVIAPATESAFPGAEGSSADAPQYGFPQVLTGRLADGGRGLVAPFLAPRCNEEGEARFSSNSLGADTVTCSEPERLRQAFVVDAATGSTRSVTLLSAHLLGAAAELDDGRVAISGGLTAPDEGTSPSQEAVSEDAGEDAVALPALHAPRALHTATGLFERGVLTLGGVRWDGETLTLLEQTAELLWL